MTQSLDSNENKIVYAKLLAKAWLDPTFNANLHKDPTKVARENHMDLHGGASVKVISSGSVPFSVDTSGPHPVVVLLITPRPADLSDDEITAYVPEADAYLCSSFAP